MTPPHSISNAVLQERIDQQHTQVMLSLAQLTDKVTMLCQRVQETEVAKVEDQARITALEKQHVTMQTEQSTLQDSLTASNVRIWRITVAVALIAGATSAAADKLMGLLF